MATASNDDGAPRAAAKRSGQAAGAPGANSLGTGSAGATGDKSPRKTGRAAGKAPAASKKTARTKASAGTAKTPASAAKSAAKPRSRKAPAEPKPKKPSRRTASRKGALVVVESPAKARTINKYLGSGYTVKASVGHVKDLPKSKLGVDIDAGFEPEYVVMRDKKKVISDIRKAAKTAEVVYLAPDPDREGEAIAWHIAEEVRPVNPNVRRVLFNEITKKGITEALQHPTELNVHKTEAQQARRVLDRLVGYQISPLLWKKVRRGLSAGRVQSVAVRIIVEREREIAAFVPEEYWTVEAECRGPQPPPFAAKVVLVDGDKAEPKTQADAEAIVAELEAGRATVAKVERKERKRRPPAPFITSKLQQDAARKLRFTAKRTMALAQRLYEGLDLGEEGPVGLITYMRTDSVRLSDDAVAMARAYIGERFGADYLPAKPNQYKNKKSAQDAHEAIRPTSTAYPPERVEALLRASGDREAGALVKLYTLIWNRFIASQMAPAVYDQTSVDIARGRAVVRATGQVMKFPGFTAVYTEQLTDDEAAEKQAEADRLLPPLSVGDSVELVAIRPEQHFTQPPPRFTEASLVKELEEDGIGRPSTYASILSTIVDRGYVEKRDGRFYPTELGTLVNDLLVDAFPDILNTQFTAQMEENLDRVEDGEVDWRTVLGEFYRPFSTDLVKAEQTMRDVKREEIATEFTCEQCGEPMVVKWGRNGSFLACKGYPECRNTKEIERQADGSFEIVPEEETDEVCDACGAPMRVKRGKYGAFLACSRYPDCKTTKPISLGVDCPKPDCDGFLTEKRSRRGKVFYGCSNYAKTGCDFVSWDRPVPEPCPQCGAKFVVRKQTRRGVTVRCLSCDFKRSDGEEISAA
ncbi:MAG: type I DNA topoisomerase [Deltaproteobacteria bacterium]|nr:MAG: type I DNA topoisomerase [Deltaproteobacteria bacterium]